MTTGQALDRRGEPPVTEAICLRLRTAQRALGIGKTKMYELIAAGEIEAVKMGRSTLVIRQSLEQYVARLPRL